MELPEEWIDIDVDTINDLMIAQCVAENFFKVTFNE
jgi:hypothetical protein